MQALHRIYRIGSEKTKTCNWYVYMSLPATNSGVTDTIDTRIDEVLEERVDRLYELLDDELLLEPFSLDSTDKDDKVSLASDDERKKQDDALKKLAGR